MIPQISESSSLQSAFQYLQKTGRHQALDKLTKDAHRLATQESGGKRTESGGSERSEWKWKLIKDQRHSMGDLGDQCQVDKEERFSQRQALNKVTTQLEDLKRQFEENGGNLQEGQLKEMEQKYAQEYDRLHFINEQKYVVLDKLNLKLKGESDFIFDATVSIENSQLSSWGSVIMHEAANKGEYLQEQLAIFEEKIKHQQKTQDQLIYKKNQLKESIEIISKFNLEQESLNNNYGSQLGQVEKKGSQFDQEKDKMLKDQREKDRADQVILKQIQVRQRVISAEDLNLSTVSATKQLLLEQISSTKLEISNIKDIIKEKKMTRQQEQIEIEKKIGVLESLFSIFIAKEQENLEDYTPNHGNSNLSNSIEPLPKHNHSISTNLKTIKRIVHYQNSPRTNGKSLNQSISNSRDQSHFLPSFDTHQPQPQQQHINSTMGKYQNILEGISSTHRPIKINPLTGRSKSTPDIDDKTHTSPVSSIRISRQKEFHEKVKDFFTGHSNDFEDLIDQAIKEYKDMKIDQNYLQYSVDNLSTSRKNLIKDLKRIEQKYYELVNSEKPTKMKKIIEASNEREIKLQMQLHKESTIKMDNFQHWCLLFLSSSLKRTCSILSAIKYMATPFSIKNNSNLSLILKSELFEQAKLSEETIQKTNVAYLQQNSSQKAVKELSSPLLKKLKYSSSVIYSNNPQDSSKQSKLNLSNLQEILPIARLDEIRGMIVQHLRIPPQEQNSINKIVDVFRREPTMMFFCSHSSIISHLEETSRLYYQIDQSTKPTNIVAFAEERIPFLKEEGEKQIQILIQKLTEQHQSIIKLMGDQSSFLKKNIIINNPSFILKDELREIPCVRSKNTKESKKKEDYYGLKNKEERHHIEEEREEIKKLSNSQLQQDQGLAPILQKKHVFSFAQLKNSFSGEEQSSEQPKKVESLNLLIIKEEQRTKLNYHFKKEEMEQELQRCVGIKKDFLKELHKMDDHKTNSSSSYSRAITVSSFTKIPSQKVKFQDDNQNYEGSSLQSTNNNYSHKKLIDISSIKRGTDSSRQSRQSDSFVGRRAYEMGVKNNELGSAQRNGDGSGSPLIVQNKLNLQMSALTRNGSLPSIQKFLITNDKVHIKSRAPSYHSKEISHRDSMLQSMKSSRNEHAETCHLSKIDSSFANSINQKFEGNNEKRDDQPNKKEQIGFIVPQTKNNLESHFKILASSSSRKQSITKQKLE